MENYFSNEELEVLKMLLNAHCSRVHRSMGEEGKTWDKVSPQLSKLHTLHNKIFDLQKIEEVVL